MDQSSSDLTFFRIIAFLFPPSDMIRGRKNLGHTSAGSHGFVRKDLCGINISFQSLKTLKKANHQLSSKLFDQS